MVTRDDEAHYFKIVVVMLQGDSLAPFLFILILDYFIHETLDRIAQASNRNLIG